VLQEEAAPRQPPGQEQELRFQTPADGIPLRDFITWAGRHLDGAVTFAPPAIEEIDSKKPRVIMEKARTLGRAELLGFAQDLLAPHGLVLFNLGRPDRPLWLVESLARPTVLAGRAAYVPPERIEERSHDRTPVTTVLKLKQVRFQDVQNEIVQALGKRGTWGESVIPVPAVNGFILKESGQNVHHMVQLIRRLDIPSGTPAAPVDQELADQVRKLEKRIQGLERRLAALEK